MNRVERLIRASFMDLLKTKSFYEIQVKQILERDQISRTSFYKYYQDKYDLLDSIESELLATFDEYVVSEIRPIAREHTVLGIPTNQETFSKIFEWAEDNIDLLSTLFGPNGDGLFHDKVIQHIIAQPYFLLDDNKLQTAISKDHWEYINAFLANGYMGIFERWILQGKRRRSAQEMGTILASIVREYFGIADSNGSKIQTAEEF